MLAKVLSSTVVGIEAHPVEVEVDIGNGLPAFNIVKRQLMIQRISPSNWQTR